jgi:molecular chaperone GrpE (heat shock protein)
MNNFDQRALQQRIEQNKAYQTEFYNGLELIQTNLINVISQSGITVYSNTILNNQEYLPNLNPTPDIIDIVV